MLPNSFKLVLDLLLLLYIVRHRIEGASLDRAESLGFLTLSDRKQMTFFATFSIFDATVSIFSLAQKAQKLV